MSKARLVITAVTRAHQPVAQVAREYDVARSWIYELLARYREEGEAAFQPRSRRHAGRLHHIGVGRTYAGTYVLILAEDLNIRIIDAATGEILRDFVLDPTKDYQPTGRPPGRLRSRSSAGSLPRRERTDHGEQLPLPNAVSAGSDIRASLASSATWLVGWAGTSHTPSMQTAAVGTWSSTIRSISVLLMRPLRPSARLAVAGRPRTSMGPARLRRRTGLRTRRTAHPGCRAVEHGPGLPGHRRRAGRP